MKTGAELITEERQRQIEIEGWTAEHDDKYTGMQLEAAAESYLVYGNKFEFQFYPPAMWPWDRSWWKPTLGDEIRNLVKAGALIAAAIDRKQREQS